MLAPIYQYVFPAARQTKNACILVSPDLILMNKELLFSVVAGICFEPAESVLVVMIVVSHMILWRFTGCTGAHLGFTSQWQLQQVACEWCRKCRISGFHSSF